MSFFVDRNLQLIAMPAVDSLEKTPETDVFLNKSEFRKVNTVLEARRKLHATH